MKRFFPQTLFVQTLTLLLAGIALSLLVGAWIYSSASHQAVRSFGALAAAERIINLSRLIAGAPVEWRHRLVAGSNDATFQVELTNSRPVFLASTNENNATNPVASFLRQALPTHKIMASVLPATTQTPFQPAPSVAQTVMMMRSNMMRHKMMGERIREMRMMRHKMMYNSLALASMSWRGLRVAVELDENQWLTFATFLPETGPKLSSRLLWALLAMASMIALLTIWAVRRMTAPLRILSDAAGQLGRNVEAPPLIPSGSVEMRHASEAFNQMQERLRRMIENRTLMLGAISHDLRTQMTLLRLRLEAGEMIDGHKRMLKTIGEMEEMLKATQSFSRDEASSEEQKRVDLRALLASIIDDMADAGLKVTLKPVKTETIIDCKPVALRRALVNVIDNAVKYGSSAFVGLSTTPQIISIAIDDEGPGIPQEQLTKVLQPFYRLESSRNRETGGIGLGLAIAASICETHGGELNLINRPEGGLRVVFVLPR